MFLQSTLGRVVVTVSRLCYSLTPNTVFLESEEEEKGRICQSMSDPPNPQVRQEALGRKTVTGQTETQPHTH